MGQARPFDVAVIGAGVVGCAVARRFTLEGATVAVIEKASDILEGASKGNSAILHTGFDAPEGSLELQCIREGHAEYLAIRAVSGLPLLESGAFVVAWCEAEEAALPAILARAQANGCDRAQLVGARTLRTREPNLAAHARAGVEIPGENLIDPWSAPLAYLSQAIANGAQLFLETEIIGGDFDGALWRLRTAGDDIACGQVINCAGLYGDLLDRALLGAAAFEIKPRKGQFVVFDKAAHALVNSIILPVPTEHSKGIVICPTVFGNLLVGPTAEDQESRSEATVDRETLQRLLAVAAEKVPALSGIPVTAAYAGIRPATEKKDYRIEAHSDRCWITVGGIRSTGLTAALGIANHVFRLYADAGKSHESLHDPAVPQVPCLAEYTRRDWSLPGRSGIVCHCELVTEREIRNALLGPLAARNLGGLKRRTRVMMGHCQGFYCSARLAALTADKLRQPMAVETLHG